MNSFVAHKIITVVDNTAESDLDDGCELKSLIDVEGHHVEVQVILEQHSNEHKRKQHDAAHSVHSHAEPATHILEASEHPNGFLHLLQPAGPRQVARFVGSDHDCSLEVTVKLRVHWAFSLSLYFFQTDLGIDLIVLNVVNDGHLDGGDYQNVRCADDDRNQHTPHHHYKLVPLFRSVRHHFIQYIRVFRKSIQNSTSRIGYKECI